MKGLKVLGGTPWVQVYVLSMMEGEKDGEKDPPKDALEGEGCCGQLQTP